MAVLKIYNDIATEDQKLDYWFAGSDAVCFKDIEEFIASIPGDDPKIELKLNCRGGNVQEGWAIYDALRATGKEISAVIEGKCASMATIILLSAKKELRSGQPNASLCIHSPYIPEYTLSGSYKSEDLRAIAENLEKEHSKFLDIYTERTGAVREELESLMKEDKYMSMDRAKTLGFIDHIIPPLSASKTNSMDKSKKTSVRKLLNDFAQGLMTALGAGEDIVAMELSTESGETLTIEKEEGEPAVGDIASPDGSHVMPDGTTIVVTDGAITEIIPAEEEEKEDPAENTELEEAKAKIAELEAQLQAEKDGKAQAQAQAKTKEEMEILNAVAIAGGKEWLAKAKSDYKVATRTPNRTEKENNEGGNKMSLREYLASKNK